MRVLASNRVRSLHGSQGGLIPSSSTGCSFACGRRMADELQGISSCRAFSDVERVLEKQVNAGDSSEQEIGWESKAWW